MNKKLPSIFKNNISKKTNNKEYCYVSEQKNIEEPIINDNIIIESIDEKINKLFNSKNYIYKIDVDIYLNDQVLKKRIIGRNKTQLITIDNEIIEISEIKDIKKSL